MLNRILWRSYKPSIKFGKTETFVTITNREALNLAMDEEIARDSSVFVIGEEVAKYNGAYKVTKGLFDKYGDKRIVDTPITQCGFTGLAIGASLMGLRPIVQFMTMNFSLQAIDHIVNSSAKVSHMSNGILNGSIVFRGLNGPAASVAAQHSQCFASCYANIPGLVVVSPYDAQDCKGLLKSAIRDPNPVVFLQNQMLYSEQFKISKSHLDQNWLAPIGKAKVMRKGRDISLVAFSRMVKVCLEAADQLQKRGVQCEVINLRTIKPLDFQTIKHSVEKTKHIITVEDGFPQSGVGAEIAAQCFQHFYEHLDAPLVRLTGMDVPIPYSPELQKKCYADKQRVIQAVERSLYRKNK